MKFFKGYRYYCNDEDERKFASAPMLLRDWCKKNYYDKDRKVGCIEIFGVSSYYVRYPFKNQLTFEI